MLGWIVHQWPLKLAALAAAGALWFFVASTERVRVVVQAPVEWTGLGEDRMLVGPRLDAVDVEVEAVRWVATRLATDRVRLRVNLSGFAVGESVVMVSPSDVQVPRGAEVTRITPARMRVIVAGASRQTVRVSPQILGTPAPGYVVGRITVEPPAVQIKGPRSTIESRDAVTTIPVDVSGRRETLARSVALALPDAVEPTRERTVRVTVEIRAEETMSQKRTSR